MSDRVTANSRKFCFSDFVHSEYGKLLDSALRQYQFTTYEECLTGNNFLLWRHDLDFSVLDAIPLARMEQERGVIATYFVNLHDPVYNALEAGNASALREIISLGHRIGLHFDASFRGVTDAASLSTAIQQEAGFLEELFAAPVGVFSFHNPTPQVLSFDDPKYGGRINTYSRHFRKELAYCSDSNGYWRHARLVDVLAAPASKSLQVLTHPLWWTETVMSPREKIERTISEAGARFTTQYAQALAGGGRSDIDW